MNYFIVDNGQQAGPYTIDELVKRGLNSDTLVWAEGMTDWTPAWQVEELKTIFMHNRLLRHLLQIQLHNLHMYSQNMSLHQNQHLRNQRRREKVVEQLCCG